MCPPTDTQSIGNAQKTHIYSVIHDMTPLFSANPVQIAVNLPPSTDPDLSTAELAFASEYAASGNATAAYRKVRGDEPGRSPLAVRVDAHRMARSPAVAARVAQLRRVAAEALNTSVAELALQAHELATASMHDLQPVELYGCRHCHGIDGRYQWRDANELCAALEAHLKSIGAPKPLPLPDGRGGYGYSTRSPVNPECETCRGHGVPIPRIVPTAELSAGARALYAGVQLRDDGTVERVLIEDRTKWADMRNKLIGAYVIKTESKSFNVNYNLNAPATPQAPLSAEDALARLRAIGALAPDTPADASAPADASIVSEQ
jgi:phage terminase small subunit